MSSDGTNGECFMFIMLFLKMFFVLVNQAEMQTNQYVLYLCKNVITESSTNPLICCTVGVLHTLLLSTWKVQHSSSVRTGFLER